jgi:hemolysin activation/secretion protein
MKRAEFMMYRVVSLTLAAVVCGSGMSQLASAQSIPSSAEIDRVQGYQIEKYAIEPAPVAEDQQIPDGLRYTQPPPNADQITFLLREVSVQGVSVYDQNEITELYKEDLEKNITLDRVWRISDEITHKYRKDGYFLSRAFVPAQEIGDGRIVIKVVEGYIHEVKVEKDLQDSRIIRQLNNELTSHKPVSSKDLEKYHFLLTDLAGLQNLQGTLAPIPGYKDGGVQLVYSRNDTAVSGGFAGINNYGSQYLGPTQALAYWQGSLIPLENTFIAVRSTLPFDEMKAVNAAQMIPITPDTNVTISAGYSKANPGFSLSPQELESQSIDVGVTVTHKIVRQRTENWSASLGIDGRNSKSTILGSTELSEDHVRAVRASSTYDTYDSTGAFNTGTVTVSKGLSGLGSSKDDDLNLSRDGASPDFTKIEMQYLRHQALPYEVGLSFQVQGQKASGSLYSSEEFGFGGSDMGRAYDSSEITGDDGIAASIEAQYQGLPDLGYFEVQPYTYYDIGKVWNHNSGQSKSVSASSTGIGVRFDHVSGLTGVIQAAFPLTKDADTPLYGGKGSSPRVGFQVGYRY